MAIANISFSKEYANSPVYFHPDKEYRDNLKHKFIQMFCGIEEDSSEIQQELLSKIKYVCESMRNGDVDRDIADYFLRSLTADFISIKMSDSFGKWTKKTCRNNIAHQFVFPGME